MQDLEPKYDMTDNHRRDILIWSTDARYAGKVATLLSGLRSR